MKRVLLLLLSLSLNTGFAQMDHGLSTTKLGHDSVHRLGKLVDTGKIDEVFIKDLKSLEIVSLSQQNGAAYSITASAGTDSKTIMTFDMMGKYLSNKLQAQTPSNVRPFEVDSSELIAESLHWVMENAASNTDLKEFASGVSKIILNDQKNDDGSSQPLISISSPKTTKILQIVISGKGEVLSFSILE